MTKNRTRKVVEKKYEFARGYWLDGISQMVPKSTEKEQPSAEGSENKTE